MHSRVLNISTAVWILACAMVGGCNQQPPKRAIPQARLEFRVAVSQADLTSEESAQLQTSTDSDLPVVEGFKWFPIASLSHWTTTRSGETASDAFLLAAEQGGLIARQHKSGLFVLLHDDSPHVFLADSSWRVETASRTQDELGRQVVLFELDKVGAERFAALTGKSIGRNLGILIDEELYAAPVIMSQISRRGIIPGKYSNDELTDLTERLRGQ